MQTTLDLLKPKDAFGSLPDFEDVCLEFQVTNAIPASADVAANRLSQTVSAQCWQP